MKKTICVLLAILMFVNLCAFSTIDYNKAMNAYEIGEYEEAAELFSALGNYEDSPKMYMYCKAIAMGDNGRYEDAAKAMKSFSEIYKESDFYYKYFTAMAIQNGEEDPVKLSEAAELFENIFLFRNSADMAELCEAKSVLYSFVDANGNISLESAEGAYQWQRQDRIQRLRGRGNRYRP